jgi:hypothetical protein
MHSLSAASEYVCSTTAAANASPTISACVAGKPTLPIAPIAGASATVAVRTVSSSLTRALPRLNFDAGSP